MITPTGTPGDEHWMAHALALAERAAEAGEVPVGAVLVQADRIIGEGWNRPLALNDPTAHAEVLALREAGRRLANYRLVDTVLYVTLEPCVMCAGAITYARVARLVYGAADPRGGAAGSVFPILGGDRLNHRVAVESGVMAARCSELLQRFFRMRREACA
ncbi:MAG: tRNA adenosine(34) deaminase TadA [Gammaproteobacteria bacterium]